MEMWLQRQAHYSLSCLWHSAHKLSAIYLTLKYLKTNSILLIHITLVMNKNDRGVISQIMIFGHLPPGPPPSYQFGTWILPQKPATSRDQSNQVEIGRVTSDYQTGRKMTSPLRSHQVRVGRFLSDYQTCRSMTCPPRSCLVRLGRVRSRYLTGLILVLS